MKTQKEVENQNVKKTLKNALKCLIMTLKKMKLIGVDRTPKPQSENPMWLTPELEKQAKQNDVPQDVEPLSPKEASDVIYGGIPGTTKIGDVNIAPIGKDWQQKAANIPQSVLQKQ